MKSILLIVTVFPLLFLAKPCMAYITATSADLAFIDGRHKCDKPGLPSCYSIGYKGGLIDGQQQHTLNRVVYSALAGCGSVGASASPNYCNGYILGYNKAYGHFSNNTEIWSMGNQSGFNTASGNVETMVFQNHTNTNTTTNRVASSCTDGSKVFCNAYAHGYNQGYVYGLSYWPENFAGGNAANQDAATCHLQNYASVKPPGELSATYILGFQTGYGDMVAELQNDDGTYGNGCKQQ